VRFITYRVSCGIYKPITRPITRLVLYWTTHCTQMHVTSELSVVDFRWPYPTQPNPSQI